jgi:hypothetical protein
MKVDKEVGERVETVDALCRAFYVVRKGLSTHPEVNAVRVRLTPREVAVLSAAHAVALSTIIAKVDTDLPVSARITAAHPSRRFWTFHNSS